MRGDSLSNRMKIMTFRLIGVVLISAVAASSAHAQRPTNKAQLANQIRSEFLHSWNGYKKYAWGHDDLKPLSKGYHDWYAEPLLMTPVDALDTMILMGLLGGLLSSYQLTGDQRLLNLATDLGRRLLPVFESPTGLPYRYVNLK